MTSTITHPELLASETWNTERAARPQAQIDWLWPGYLAHGAVTLLTSQAKTGKTTLISALVAKMARGGELAGLTVRPARVAIVSEELARGCGALGAFADNQMEMSLIGSALETDRRRIAAWSRFEETPRRLLVELSADGCDYRTIPEAEQEDSFSRHWPAVERLLAFPPRKLTRQELLVGWRAKVTAPSPTTLWRVLDRAAEAGLLLCDGAGTCLEPYRYWLAVLPAQWETRDDPAADYWPLVQHLLSFPPRKLSQPQLLHKWTKAGGAPNPALLDACLKQAVSEGRLLQEGTGRRGDPLRYHIDGLDAAWEPDITELLTF